MTDLQKLQNQDEKDKATIAKLVAKSEAIEAVILQDPDNSKAALEAAGIDKQIQAAYKARQRTLQAIEAEQKRLYESEVKAAQDELEKIREKTAAIKEQEFEKAREFFDQYEAWLALVNRHAELAKKYSIAAPNLYALDAGQAGITALKKALDQFTAAQQNIEVQRQFMKAMSAKND
jgi:exonuclease VII large subunit